MTSYIFLTDECDEEGFSGRGFSRIFCSMYPAIFYSSNPFPFISLLLLLLLFSLSSASLPIVQGSFSE
jgi:hypothetical protein